MHFFQRQTKTRASNCLPHNEHPFSYFTCVIALFGWSCHHVFFLFRCTNMRNVGKSNQDAKIMMCYEHKHKRFMQWTFPKQSQVNHVQFPEAPAVGNHHHHHRELDSLWTPWWIHMLSVSDKWDWIYTSGTYRNWWKMTQIQTGQYTCGMKKHELKHTDTHTHTHTHTRARLISTTTV